MLNIGITGGIGSGKTTVCKIFEKLGIPVYYADDRAKQLMIEKTEIIEQITEIFGKRAYYKNGKLNRRHIAKIAFSTPDKLKALNAVVHPAVKQDGIDWAKAQKNAPYTLKEAALMIESGNYKVMDKLVVVAAPEKIRLARVMSRDDATKAEVKARMDKQLPEAEKIKLADYVINNDGSKSLILQIWKLHQEFLKFSSPVD